MADIMGFYFLTVQNTDGSYVWYQKQFPYLNEAVAYAAGNYLQPLFWDVPEAAEHEPRFGNNAYASIDLATGTIAKIYISRTTYGVAGFQGDVRTITIESAAAVLIKDMDALKNQATN